MKHFNNTTGKNKDKLQIQKLATFLDKDEGTLRAYRKRNEEEFNMLHLGAICKVNDISLEQIMNKDNLKHKIFNMTTDIKNNLDIDDAVKMNDIRDMIDKF